MIVFADKQDITRVGLIHVADSLSEAPQYRSVEDKATLIETLNEESDAVVISTILCSTLTMWQSFKS